MAGPQAWSRLRCNGCGVSTEFIKKVYLITRQGGGTTDEVAGYVCRQCNGDVDPARMHANLERDRKRAELKELEAELGEAPAPAVIRGPDTAASKR